MKNKSKVIPINWVDDIDRWILVPGTIKEGVKRRIKEVPFSKNNCYFASGFPKSLFDFTYRAIKKLNLTERKLIFSRGTVRTIKRKFKNAASIRELEWGVGTLITIPQLVKYREKITLCIENTEHHLRLMELIILQGLLRISQPNKKQDYYSAMSAMILTGGWEQLNKKKLPVVVRKISLS